MRAVEIRSFGPPEGLAVIDLPDPAPAGYDVIIDVVAGADMPAFSPGST
jgi:NADPH:quinone reductase-like Zn-dependent oxidoreductase